MKQLLKKLVTSTFGKDFYLGKIKFASTEQDCPQLMYHLTYMKVKCKLLFNNLMSLLGLIKFWLVCKDENECSKGIQSKSFSVLLKYFPCQKCLLSFNFSKCCHSPLCWAQTTFSFVLTRYLCKFLFMGHFIIIYQIWNFNPLTPKILLVILRIVWHVIFMMLVWRIGVGST